MTTKLLTNTHGIEKRSSDKSYSGMPITEIITNGFFTVDRSWTVKYWNRAAEKLLNVSAKDIVGKNLWEEFADVLPLEFYTVYHKAFLEDVPVHFEEYWGEMGTWFDVITYHSEDTLSVSFKSTSQPEHQEMQLRMLNELYRFVEEVTNVCLWEWNFQTKEILWIDGGHKRVFGYNIENALIPQIFWESRLHPDDKERILTRVNKIIRGGLESEWEDDYRFKKANGEYAYVHDRGHIIYDDGKASRMIGATQDITARRSAEIQLLESEKKLALIARQMLNSVTITDVNGKIIWINDAFTRITENLAEDVMGKKRGDILQGKETSHATIEYINNNIKNKLPFDCEILSYTKSGRKFWMRLQGQPLLDENGNYERYYTMGTDITERVLLENKLTQERISRQKEITEAVLTAQENERADIGKELHDNLNQILAVAKLYIQMSKTYPDKRDMYLDKSCDFIENVIGEIRRISKALVIPGKHIIGLFDNIKNLLRDLVMTHQIKIEFHEEGVIEDDLSEKMQLTIFRIVQEQLNNILKHARATRASINLSSHDNQLILVISDNGDGYDILKGSKGVGITNIKSRAELYRGSVTIVTKPGEGYVLKVIFPLNDQVLFEPGLFRAVQ